MGILYVNRECHFVLSNLTRIFMLIAVVSLAHPYVSSVACHVASEVLGEHFYDKAPSSK